MVVHCTGSCRYNEFVEEIVAGGMAEGNEPDFLGDPNEKEGV